MNNILYIVFMFSRIRQDGGGKMSKTDKDIYLGHCDVILNTEKKPLTVNQIMESADYLFENLRKSAYEHVSEKLNYGIDESSSGKPQLTKSDLFYNLLYDIISIFESADDIYDEYTKEYDPNNSHIDTNRLRIHVQTFINIVSLQVVIAFTYYCLRYREPEFEDFDNVRFIYNEFMNFIDNTKYTNRKWIKYDYYMLKTIIIEFLSKNNGLIVTMTHFGVDNMIQILLNNQCICGMSFNPLRTKHLGVGQICRIPPYRILKSVLRGLNMKTQMVKKCYQSILLSMIKHIMKILNTRIMIVLKYYLCLKIYMNT